ncbi:MAG: hypothetical protein JWM55_1698 [Acidimicrobiaceae bacterium]|nr:hypothetical protein [Acidimicrobiaceae bacterium]
MLQRGIKATQATVLAHGRVDPGLDSIATPTFANLGQIPDANAPSVTAFWNAVYSGQTELVSWWLDRMVAADHPLSERMTWFWHGHWATSVDKVIYPLTMQKQNETLRKYALANFKDMAREMVVDGAFNFWLDNEENYLSSPNENLARELMELMTIGVNNFTQHDVTAAARALTGYSTNLSSGTVTFDAQKHFSHPLTVLGTTSKLDARSLASLIVSNGLNAKFITERMWFRFVSATTKPPAALARSFATRNNFSLVSALVRSNAWSNPANSLVKSPIEWFVGACRAMKIRPSSINAGNLHWYLSQMGQLPFNPPNVGGWPYGQAWLSGAAFQYRFMALELMVAEADLSPINVPKSKMVQACADWLGIPEWSRRTASTLAASSATPAEFATVALLSPEYVVSA